jgi:hypothetical protein
MSDKHVNAAAVASLGGNGDLPRRGRPTKFCKEIADNIAGLISHGMPITYASAVAGISHETYHTWQRKYSQFREQIAAARARGIAARLAVISKAIDAGDVRAAMWWLEHVHPEHFARNRVEVTGANGGPLTAGIGIYLPQKDGGSEPIQINPPVEPLPGVSDEDETGESDSPDGAQNHEDDDQS